MLIWGINSNNDFVALPHTHTRDSPEVSGKKALNLIWLMLVVLLVIVVGASHSFRSGGSRKPNKVGLDWEWISHTMRPDHRHPSIQCLACTGDWTGGWLASVSARPLFSISIIQFSFEPDTGSTFIYSTRKWSSTANCCFSWKNWIGIIELNKIKSLY